ASAQNGTRTPDFDVDTYCDGGRLRHVIRSLDRSCRLLPLLLPPAEVPGEEGLRRRVEALAVVRLRQPVALVVEQQVLVVDVLLPERRNDLLGLGLLHPRVVRA